MVAPGDASYARSVDSTAKQA